MDENGNPFARFRADQQITNAKLARLLGVSTGYVAGLCTGAITTVSPRMAIKAEKVGVGSYEEIMGWVRRNLEAGPL